MSIRKNWRTTLLVLLITVTFTSVIGGTMAWFTDTVESNTNVIEAGTLDAELYSWNPETNSWDDASSGTIFNYRNWEPGYTQVRYVKISNVGTLAFDYSMMIKTETPWLVQDDNGDLVPTEEPYKLADVIDVYVVDAPCAKDADGNPTDTPIPYASFTAIKEAVPANTTIRNITDTAFNAVNGGRLNAGESVVLCVALNMQETAGNEYQGLSVGKGFALQVQAKQATVEEDAFGDQYDADAVYANLPSAIVVPFTAEELAQVNADYEPDLQTAYTFRTAEDLSGMSTSELEEYAANHPFANWHADFVVSFDADVAADSMHLAGAYGAWENGGWLSFPVPEITKGDEYRLLGEGGEAITGKPIYMPYVGIVGEVQEFTCGVSSPANNSGTTMTVELRLYEVLPRTPENNSDNTESGRYVTIGTFEYQIP